jgi:hypothetical protein
VAELHLEIESRAGALRILPRPGVVPPTLAGAPVRSACDWPPGVVLALGGVRLSVEPEPGAPAPSAASAKPAAHAPSAAAAKAGARAPQAAASAPRGARAGASSAPRARESARPRPGAWKAYALPAAVLAALGLGGIVAWRVLARAREQMSMPADVALAGARREMAQANSEAAAKYLVLAEADRSLSEAQRAEIAQMRAALTSEQGEVERVHDDAAGEAWFNVKLAKYESIELRGAPQPHKVRLFLERCAEFRKRWPQHERIDWVERQEQRFAGVVDLQAPRTQQDVLWQVDRLTAGAPAEWGRALGILDERRARTTDASERAELDELRATKVVERREAHVEYMHAARAAYQRGDKARAVELCAQSVIHGGDPELAAEAARYLIAMPELGPALSQYRTQRPWDFAALMREPALAEFARGAGIAPAKTP